MKEMSLKVQGFLCIASYTKTPRFQVFNLSTGLSLNERLSSIECEYLFNEEYVPVMSLLRS